MPACRKCGAAPAVKDGKYCSYCSKYASKGD